MDVPAKSRIERYRSEGYQAVDGWLQKEIIWLIEALDRFHDANAISGGYCEIGVHHGRLFFALANVCKPDDFGLAIDIFDNQELNVDKSGHGDRKIFEQGLRKYCPESTNVVVKQADSTDRVTVKRIPELAHSFRFFSVDGGHTFQHLIADLAIADETLVNGGFVLIDDYCNAGFPGVTEGLIAYLARGGRLLPVCATGGKIILTSLSYVEAAQQHLRVELANASSFRYRKEPSFLCGHPYLFFKPDTRARL